MAGHGRIFATLLFGLALVPQASIAGFVGQCGRICSDEIATCVAGGERRTRCVQQVRSRCRREGPQVCGGAVPPDSVTARATARRTVAVGWRDTNANERAYLIERSRAPAAGFAVVASVAADTVAYTDTGLADGATYYYRLRTVGPKGGLTSASAIASATTPTAGPPDPGPGAVEPGHVHFVQTAKSSFDRYTSNPTPALQQWMRDHYWRMLTYAPYFDSRLAWYPNAWAYQDLYAIYPGQSLAAQHPEWILKDASGNPLYIPFACSNGSCSQYAGDIGDPGFRAWWIAAARARVAPGYRGLFVDDVNLAMKVSDGTGTAVAPWDRRLGRLMTETDWRQYMAEFTEQIRAALPNIEIVHNQVWFFAPVTDPFVQRALDATDFVEVERGFNDTGIRGGTGKYGFETLAAYIDTLHARGKGVFLNVEVSWGAEYALATYFLVSSGRDGLGNDGNGLPDAWWAGYDVDLGAPLGDRYAWNGLVRRDFASGIVLVNEPEQPAHTVDLGGTYRGLDGQLRTSVTLGPTTGVVLRVP